jgi:NTP pyrophosphatase (non-canonical NTP hydrolase)
MYFIYHIFGKKIGVTRNLNSRVTREQGYKENEYEVLETSDDIDYVSSRELELQSIYGYKIDRQSYKNLTQKQTNQMVLNVTEQTTTFPCPVNKLKGNLLDNKGIKIETSFGKYVLTDDLAEWIVKNANTSMFNPARSYVYNKALDEFTKSLGKRSMALEYKNQPESVKVEDPNIYDLIRQWADERGIYRNGDTKTQFVKLQEESGELARAILKDDKVEFVDAIGDMVVVLTNLAALEGLKIEDCVTSAYSVIKLRQGSMVNGTFVKENPSIIPQTVFNTNPSDYQLTKTL